MPKYIQYHYGARERAKRKAREVQLIPFNKQEKKGREDFSFFCEYVTRNATTPLVPAKHHKEWHDLLITNQDSKCLHRISGSNLDILAPRGSAKSSVLGLFVAWVIGIHTAKKMVLPILYISYSLIAARAKSATIKMILESTEYKQIFPEVKKGKKWSDQYWQIDYAAAGIKNTGSEQFSVACCGLTGSITSKRAALIIIDDPIKSSEQIASLQTREKMARNWRMVVRPTLLEGGRCICLGTRFRPDDVHVELFSPDKGWLQIEQSALVSNEHGQLVSYWEKMWSLEYLLSLQKEDPHSFAFQYLNKIQSVKSLGIKPEWVKYVNTSALNFDSYVISVDLASSLKQKADYTAIFLLGRLKGEYYFIDYRRGRWSGNLEKCEVILSLVEDWLDWDQFVDIYVESGAYQASFKGDFTDFVTSKSLYNLRCIPWRLRGDKLAHILSVSGLYASGLVFYNSSIFHSTCPAILEMVEFGNCKNDDCMDATVMALQGAAKNKKLESI
jgi:phage terminase large subunit-like protein